MVGRSDGQDPPRVINPVRVQQVINNDGQETLDVYPITFDYPQDSSGMAEDEGQLTDFVGQEYIVKRIVGNIFCVNTSDVVGSDNGTTFLKCVTVVTNAAAGFFVARAADSDNSATGADVPIGMTGNTTNAVGEQDDYSPLHVDTIREPWMWRRFWPIGCRSAAFRNQQIYQTTALLNAVIPSEMFPAGNWEYNQIACGASVDIKSRRHVRQDERLWIAIANIAEGSFNLGDAQAHGQLTWYWDLRIFGQLVKAKARGAF